MEGPDQDGEFVTRLALKKGIYEYKFVIDGKVWKYDPGNHGQVGFYNNSVLVIGQKP
jgi:hypothetical protein